MVAFFPQSERGSAEQNLRSAVGSNIDDGRPQNVMQDPLLTPSPTQLGPVGPNPNGTITGWYVAPGVLVFGAIFYTFLIVVGTVGNALGIIVIWSTQSMRQSRHAFLALAIADSLCLWVNPVRYWLISLSRLDIRNLGNVACKLQSFLAYSTRDCATWVLCLLTFERFLFACMPYRSRLVWRPKPRSAVWAGILILIIVKNLPILFFLTIIRKRLDSAPGNSSGWTTVMCDTNAQQFRRVFFYLDITEYSVLPSLLLLFFNAALIRVLHRAKRCRQTMLSSTTTPRGSGSCHVSASQRQINQASRLLLPVSFCHLATSLPLCVFSIVEASLNLKRTSTTPNSIRMVQSIGFVLSLLTFCNNGCNCFIYFMSSRAFRQRFRHMIARRRTRASTAVTNSASMVYRGSSIKRCTRPVTRNSRLPADQGTQVERIDEYHTVI